MAAALLLRGEGLLHSNQAGPGRTTLHSLPGWLLLPTAQPSLGLVAKEAFSLATTPNHALDPRPPAHQRTPCQAPEAPPPLGLVARGGCTIATGPRSGQESSHWRRVARGGNCVATGLWMPGYGLNPPETCQRGPAFSEQRVVKKPKAWVCCLRNPSPPTQC